MPFGGRILQSLEYKFFIIDNLKRALMLNCLVQTQ